MRVWGLGWFWGVELVPGLEPARGDGEQSFSRLLCSGLMSFQSSPVSLETLLCRMQEAPLRKCLGSWCSRAPIP